ncbi:transglycosylase domain-containing protein [Chamaesiphon polymorphus]|uniref:Penicillin-binding protein n=1 Tax=Chamaesiphon polymorphus CCALA 037 TaxID=2107692 RepID=A0A2T1GLU8_9CYAN|nr:PBP1A family penicillin-binding protein [Chamaesiphon polymorphus]PSB58840.1 penicillin-binding protein [Chamaesiphon polymorphus CCALA 037]
MLNLFARLKGLSAKLPLAGAEKPRDDRQQLAGTNDFDRSRVSSIDPDAGSLGVNNKTREIANNLYPINASHSPTADEDRANSTLASAAPTDRKVASPAQRKAKKLVKAVGKTATAVGTTATAIGTTVGRVGTVVAKPFKGPKPLHKNRLFWAGSTLGVGMLALGGAWLFVDRSVSQYAPADALSYVRPGTITIKGLDGSILLQTGNATRETLKIWQIPEKLKKAFVAIEDRRFYEHDGVDYKGVTRAMVQNVTSKNLVEGASSINQQLARMVYLNQERSFWRKLREIRIAQRLTDGLTKDQILERYLNLVYLGEGTYGVADSAWVYFSKTVDQLTLAEMATLAAMPPAPNKYSPFVNPKFAEQRRNLVLDRMLEAKFITAAEARAAKAEPLKTKRSPIKRELQEARYFTKYIEQELPKFISAKAIKAGGLTVETTLNPEWQNKAEEIVNSTVRNNRGSFGQAAMVSIDPRTGGIRSMVGGTDFETHQFNRVTQAKRQPGSTFKPIVYATAIAGGISPNKSYLDGPFVVDGYKPKNAGKKFKGYITMHDALINSVNIIAIKILLDTGWEPVIDNAKKMGIESKLEPFYSLALGGLEVNLLEITGAYSTFAAKGVHNPVHGITRVVNQKGEVIYQNKPQPTKVFEPDTNAIMTWMMRGVVNEGTATSAQIGRPVAGKTGTTDKERDLWFIGFVPQLVTGVWLGNDNNRPTGNASSTAAYAWSRFMKVAVKDFPSQDFPARPDNLGGRKPELKLDPIKPRYRRDLPMPKDGERVDDDNRTNSEETPRRRRRRRLEANNNSNTNTTTTSSSEETPRRRRRRRLEEASTSNTSTTTTNTSNSEETPRRRRRRRSSGE